MKLLPVVMPFDCFPATEFLLLEKRKPIAAHTLQELEATMVVNKYCNCHSMMVTRYLKMVFKTELASTLEFDFKLIARLRQQCSSKAKLFWAESTA